MELEKFDRQLRLLLLLTQNASLSVESVSKELGMSRRSIYRYIDAFRQMGFDVIKNGTRYRISPSSPFFRNITDKIHFSEDEAITINQVLNSVCDNSQQVRHLRQKLQDLYDFNVLARHGVDDRMARNLNRLFEAIQQERIVVLRNYNSPHSGQISDRIVEPYQFVAENSEVRCFEISSKQNKTFKVGRAERVELLDLLWTHKDQHKEYYTDLFHFSGEQTFPVKLKLGQLATNLLLEEIPGSEPHLTLLDDGKRLFTTQVCSYVGIGRFVLGLYDDIDVVDSPDFQNYLNQRIKDLTKKIEQ